MSMSRFARMCEALEGKPNKAETIENSMSAFSDIPTVLKILSLNYEVNNIGSKRAISWIANALGLFESEIKGEVEAWGDLGEGMNQFLAYDNEDSSITIAEFYRLLEMDCSSISGNSYTLIAEAMSSMSGLELKWFIRYWLRNPRNGVNKPTVVKTLIKRYPNKNVKVHAELHDPDELFTYFESNITPPTTVKYGKFIPPMLAKSYANVLPKKYVIDFKYDGNRYQIHKQKKEVIIFNRKGKVVTHQFPDIVDIVSEFNAPSCILDTEIYPVYPDGSPAPHKVMNVRVHSKDHEKAMKRCPVKLVIFDVLQYFDSLQTKKTYCERLSHLKDFPSENRVTQYEDGDIQRAYNLAINEGFEGIMIKDLDAPYAIGKRSTSWLKHKPPRIELDVVITSAKYGEGKRSDVFGTYGISVKNGYEYVRVGSVGTGLSDKDLIFLTTELKKITESYEQEEFTFLPRYVLEVTCDLVSQDSDGNYGLRFPRVTRIRQDKHAADCTTLTEIIQYASMV